MASIRGSNHPDQDHSRSWEFKSTTVSYHTRRLVIQPFAFKVRVEAPRKPVSVAEEGRRQMHLLISRRASMYRTLRWHSPSGEHLDAADRYQNLVHTVKSSACTYPQASDYRVEGRAIENPYCTSYLHTQAVSAPDLELCLDVHHLCAS